MTDDLIKVLVAEDEAPVRSFLGTVLRERDDCEVRVAPDGAEALREIVRYRPDLLITDLRMPLLSGEDLTLRALEIDPDLTVLVETGNPTLEGAVDLLREGAYDFITKPFDLARLEASIDRAVDVSRRRRAEGSVDIIVQCLMNALEAKDPYLKGHSRRVSRYARLLGRDLGVRGEELDRLEWSALVHDLGKIGVPDRILHKRGSLDEREFDEIKHHAVRSAEIVRPLSSLKGGEAAVKAVYHHHERMDGKGYPEGLVGEEIPFHARIISVCDAYDAMTSDRPYRAALDSEAAGQRLRQAAGDQLDESIVGVFLDRLDEYKSHVLERDAVRT